MLLGVLRENEELFVKLTSSPDASRALRKSIQHHVPQSEMISTSVELPLSSATKSVLTRAFEESEAMGHNTSDLNICCWGYWANRNRSPRKRLK
jgi:hypothetical protein